MNNRCLDCDNYITEEQDIPDDDWSDIVNDDELDGYCNYHGYPVAKDNGCWRFKDKEEE